MNLNRIALGIAWRFVVVPLGWLDAGLIRFRNAVRRANGQLSV
jgi:hypothetical protein